MKASFGIETDSLLKKRLFGDPQAVVCPSDYYLKVTLCYTVALLAV